MSEFPTFTEEQTFDDFVDGHPELAELNDGPNIPTAFENLATEDKTLADIAASNGEAKAYGVTHRQLDR